MRTVELGAATFAVFLIFTAAARAKVVTLRCDYKMTLDIDLTNKTVRTMFDSQFAPQVSSAQITERFVTWCFTTDNPVCARLDRATGAIGFSPDGTSGTCKRVPKPLF